jgi:Ca2+-binding EF-hand superfamily protein/outer membrane protein OmpA-like peptidoglycan-associated protein
MEHLRKPGVGSVRFASGSWDVSSISTNGDCFDGLAAVLDRHPLAALRIRGVRKTVNRDLKPEDVSRFEQSFPGVQHDPMAAYAHARVLACRDALVRRGVAPGRLHTSHQVGEELAVYFESEPVANKPARLPPAGPSEADLRRAFTELDRARDGSLPGSALRPALRALGIGTASAEAREMLGRYEAYDRVKLTLQDFSALMRDFAGWDAPDSVIDSAELRSALEQLGLPATHAQTAAALARYDADRSGCLDFTEFNKLVRDVASFREAAAAADRQPPPPPPDAEHVRRIFAVFSRARVVPVPGAVRGGPIPPGAVQVRNGELLSWSVDHPDTSRRAANARLLDAVAAVLAAHPRVELLVQPDTSRGSDAAARALAIHLQTSDEAQIAARLSALRGAVIKEELAKRAVDVDSRVRIATSRHEAPTAFTFRARPVPAGGGSAEAESDGATLLEAHRIGVWRREQHVFLGRDARTGAESYAAVLKPSSTSVLLDTPGAFLAGEEYILETLPEPAMGVAASRVDFVMKATDLELEIEMQRPTADVTIEVRWAKQGTAHWAANLELPHTVPVLIRHADVGVIMPETKLTRSKPAVTLPDDTRIREVFHTFAGRHAGPDPPPTPADVRKAFDTLATTAAAAALPSAADLYTAFEAFAVRRNPPAAPTATKVKEVFQAKDRDRSGSLSKKELRSALQALGVDATSAQSAALLAKYDADGSGELSRSEFLAFVRQLTLAQQARFPAIPPRPRREAIQRTFSLFDKDRSGKLSKRELRAALGHLLSDASSAEAAALMSKYDADRSGTLSLQEFSSLAAELDRNRRKQPSAASVSTADLQPALATLGLEVDAEQAAAVLAKYDADGSGSLELAEFTKLLTDVMRYQATTPGGEPPPPPTDQQAEQTFRFFAREPYVSRSLDAYMFEDVFKQHDLDRSGSLSTSELRGALGSLFLTASSAKAAEVMEAHDRNKDGQLSLSEFAKLADELHERECAQARLALSAGDLRRALQRLKIDATEAQAAAVLKKFDSDASGTLDYREFASLTRELLPMLAAQRRPALSVSDLRTALRGLGVEATGEQTTAVLTKYDGDNSGTVELKEFEMLVADFHRMRHGSPAPAQAAAAPTQGLIQRIFLLFAKPPAVAPRVPVPRPAALRAAFDKFDRDRSGKINARELREAFVALMFSEVPETQTILHKYDADRSGELSLSEFRSLAHDLGTYQAKGHAAALLGSSELRPALHELGMEASAGETDAVLARYNADRSGSLEFAEFFKLVNDLAAFYAKAGGGASPAKAAVRRIFDRWSTGTALLPVSFSDADVADVFTRFDRDKSNSLSRRELPSALGELFLIASSESVKSLLAEHDTSRDRQLNYVEFGTLMRRVHEEQAAEASKTISQAGLRQALPQLGLDAVDARQAEMVMRSYDLDESGSLGLSEFTKLVTDLSAFLNGTAQPSAALTMSTRDLQVALARLGVEADSLATSSVLRKYDANRDGVLSLTEFGGLIRDLAAYMAGGQGGNRGAAAVVTPVTADRADLGLAVLRYALRSRFFVGERYTLELLDNDELVPQTLEFSVPSAAPLVVPLVLERKWRDVRVNLRYKLGVGETDGYFSLPRRLTLRARHGGLGVVSTTSTQVEVHGLTATTVLSGDEALYVRQAYSFHLDGIDGLDVLSDTSTIIPPLSETDKPLELVLGPATGEVVVELTNLLEGSGHWAESLPLPARVPFLVRDGGESGRVVLESHTNEAGRCHLRRDARLYVGRNYVLEVRRSDSLAPASLPFRVDKGEQTVRMGVHRAEGPVFVSFKSARCEMEHWAAPLPLPSRFAYRVVYKALGNIVHQAEMTDATPAMHEARSILGRNAARIALPQDRSLFIGETYTLEVGFEAQFEADTAMRRVRSFIEDNDVVFNGAGQADLPAIEQAWAIEHTDDAKFAANRRTIEGVAAILLEYPTVSCRVHGTTGGASSAPRALADHYKLDSVADVSRLMELLARNRAEACRDALVRAGVPRHRLLVSSKGMAGEMKVDFIPVAAMADAATGLGVASVDFTVRPAPQDVVLRLDRATGDINVKLGSTLDDAGRKHWTHHLTPPDGTRVTVTHAALGVLVSSGVFEDGLCYIGGEGTLYAGEEYVLAAESEAHFERTELAFALTQGVQDVWLDVAWHARRILLYCMATDAASDDSVEAYARVQRVMKDNDVIFNGAGEAGLPTIEQAWAIKHTEPSKAASNVKTIRLIAEVLKGYPQLRCEVYGATGPASTAPAPLAAFLNLDSAADVAECMDQLARRRAESCKAALVAAGVPETQLFATWKGLQGQLKVDFIPRSVGYDARTALAHVSGDAHAEAGLFPLPAGIPFELRLKSNNRLIKEGRTDVSDVLVPCPLPDGAALVVGQEYILRTMVGAGTEANEMSFFVGTESESERRQSLARAEQLQRAVAVGRTKAMEQLRLEVESKDAVVVKLPLKRSKAGAVLLVCKYDVPMVEREAPRAEAVAAAGDADAGTAIPSRLVGQEVSEVTLRETYARHAKRPSERPTPQLVDLTTGTAAWKLVKACGKFVAGPAPKTPAHNAWYKPVGFSWLGHNAAWPPGEAIFELRFDVSNADAAHFELPYTVDNQLLSATLNSNPLDVGSSAHFKTFGGDAIIKAPRGKRLFVQGSNTLRLVVANTGDRDNPMGFCAKGKAVVGYTIPTVSASAKAGLTDEKVRHAFSQFANGGTTPVSASTAAAPANTGLSAESMRRAFSTHARAATGTASTVPFSTDLSTGSVPWRLARSCGKFAAGPAPKTLGHPAWCKTAGSSWLGNTAWPPGDAIFELRFDIASPEAAELELPYSVDNAIKSVLLNGRPLSSAATGSFKTFGGDMVIRAAAGQGLFAQGENVLQVTIANTGSRDNPMGFCAKGHVTDKRAIADSTLATRDLRLALKDLGVDASAAQATSVLSRYDADGSGTLDFAEFARLATDLEKALRSVGHVPASPAPRGVSMPATVDLSTGSAPWKLARSCGKFVAGPAPKTQGHPAWCKTAGASWLGDTAWPPGDATFELRFDIASPDAADMELPYSVDNAIKSVQLNGRPLSFGSGRGSFKAFGGDMLIRAPAGQGLFASGENVLQVTIANSGSRDNPMGFCAKGHVTDVRRTGAADNAAATARPSAASPASSGSGALALRDLRRALLALGVDASTEQTKAVLSRYDADGSGTLDFSEFFSLAVDLDKALVGGGQATAEDDVALGVADLTVALRELGIDISSGTGRALLTRYDVDGSGAVDMTEFKRVVLELTMSAEVRSTFRKYDANGSGTLSKRELREALLGLDVDVTRAEATAVLREFDADGSGSLSLTEFDKLCRRLAAIKKAGGQRIVPSKTILEEHWSKALEPIRDVQYRVFDGAKIAQQVQDANHKVAAHLVGRPVTFERDSITLEAGSTARGSIQTLAAIILQAPLAALRARCTQSAPSDAASHRRFRAAFPRAEMDDECATAQGRALAIQQLLESYGVDRERVLLSWEVSKDADRRPVDISAEPLSGPRQPQAAVDALGGSALCVGSVRDGKMEPLDVYGGALSYGGSYVVQVPDAPSYHGFKASRLFRIDGAEHSITLPIRRRTAAVNLLLRADVPAGHWAAGLPFPSPFRLVVRHKGLGIAVQDYVHKDKPSAAEWHLALRQDELFVGETYAVQLEGAEGVATLEPVTHTFVVSLPSAGAAAAAEYDVGQAVQIPLLVRRATRPVTVWLVNPFPLTHWAACLPVPNGVPLSLLHRGAAPVTGGSAGREVVRSVAYDGAVRVPAADLFVGETYEVCIPETALNDAAQAPVLVKDKAITPEGPSGECVVEVGVVRAARPVHLYLLGDNRRRQAEAARREVLKFMEDHDVYFPGAAEQVTNESRLGVAQAWNINHPDQAKRKANWATIEGIAQILRRYPDIPCEVLGTTTAAKAAPAKLADYFGLERERDVHDIMERLARSRAEACQEALVERGVPLEQLSVRAVPLTGDSSKVDFVPRFAEDGANDKAGGLPAGLPFRLLHRRAPDHGLREALTKLKAFTAQHEVRFNGAGDERLTHASQAWSVAHLDATERSRNEKTLAGVAKIMAEYPDICLEVHGETGAATSAPSTLAAHFKLDRHADVQQCMDRLAEERARACADALVKYGLPAVQLVIAFRGRGGATEVRFTPRSLSPYGPMPLGDWGEYALVYEGTTEASGERVRCPLPAGAAVFVDEAYVLEMASHATRRESDPAHVRRVFAAHAALPADLPEEAKLRAVFTQNDRDRSGSMSTRELRSVLAQAGVACSGDRAGELMRRYDADNSGTLSMSEFLALAKDLIRCAAADAGTSLLRPADLRTALASMKISISAEQAAAALRGYDTDGDRGLSLPEFGRLVEDMVAFDGYRGTKPADEGTKVRTTSAIFYSAKLDFVVSSTSDKTVPVTVELPVRMAQSSVLKLHCRQASGDWTDRLPLPSGLRFSIHKVLHGSMGGTAGAGIERRAADARSRVRAFLKDNDVLFNGAGQPELQSCPLGIAQAWAIEHLDDATRQSNRRTIEGVAAILREYPEVAVEVLGQTTVAATAPAALAQAFRMHCEREVGKIMDLLAHRRAEACLEALVGAGVPRAQLLARWEGNAPEAKVDFVPLARPVGAASVTSHTAPAAVVSRASAVGSPAPAASSLAAGAAQETPVAQGSLTSRGEGYATAAIPVAHLKPGDTYEVRVFGSPQLTGGVARFAAAENAQDVDVTVGRVLEEVRVTWRWPSGSWFEKMELPMAVPITLTHGALGQVESHVLRAPANGNAELARQAKLALDEVVRFMEDNDVFFHGAKEKATRESRLGIAQAWSVEHLDEQKRNENRRILDGVAGILRRYPTISCAVHGTTTETKSPASEALAEAFRLDRDRDVDAIMETLARRRAEACREALVRRGVPPSQLYVTAKGRQGKMKVDFIPQAPPRGGATGVREHVLRLPVGERFGLQAAPLDDAHWAPGPASQHAACDFTARASAPVVLELSPPRGRVWGVFVSALHQGSGDGYSNHWLATLPPRLPERVSVEARHVQTGSSVLSEQLDKVTADARIELSAGKFVVGQTYSLSVRGDAVLEDTQIDFTVGTSGAEVRLPVRPRPARLALSFTCDGGVPHSLPYTIVAKRAPRGAPPLVSDRTPAGDARREERAVEVRCEPPRERGLVVGEEYILRIEESPDGLVAPSEVEILPVAGETRVRVPVARRNTLRLSWRGPKQQERRKTYSSGDGDDVADANRAASTGAIPFLVHTSRRAANGEPAELVLRGEKGYSDTTTELRHAGLELGQEYVLRTGRTAQWEAAAVRFIMSSSSRTLELSLERAPRGAPQLEVRAMIDPRALPEGHWAESIPLPPGLGFVARPVNSQPHDDVPGAPCVAGLLSANGRAMLSADALPANTRYTAVLVRGGAAYYDAFGISDGEMAAAVTAGAAFEQASCPFHASAAGAVGRPGEPVATLALRRRTRDVRVRLVPSELPAVAAVEPLRIELTTGMAAWRQPQVHGSSTAEPAPTAPPHAGWHVPAAGSWLGAAAGSTVGGATFELRFEIPAGYAEPPLQLPYAVEGTVSGATLNSRPLTISAGRSGGARAFGGENMIRAPSGKGYFGAGTNVLQVTVTSPEGGQREGPLGFYAQSDLLLPHAFAPAVQAPPSIPRGVRVLARHVGRGVTAAEALTDGNGIVTLRGRDALFVNEAYDLLLDLPVAGLASGIGRTTAEAPLTRFTVEDGDRDQELPDLQAAVEAVGGGGATGWYDDLPARPELSARSEADADKLAATLRRGGLLKTGMDVKLLLDVIATRRPCELQELRVAYRNRQRRELADDVAAAASILKRAGSKLEVSLLRSKDELDAISLKTALDPLLLAPLYELLCTSLPLSLVELSAAYRQLYRDDPADAIRRAGASARAGELAAVAPLLSDLLEHAASAVAFSAEASKEHDLRTLREALTSRLALEELPPPALEIFGRRTRAHLRELDSLHARLHDAQTLAQLVAERIPAGGLREAVQLLLGRPEDYFAHKLHAAFYGLKKTPALGLRTLGPQRGIMSRAGLMTHDETVISVVASRHGRDLSGVVEAYARLYRRDLPAELRANMLAAPDVGKLACAVVEHCQPYRPYERGSATAGSRSSAAW